MNELIDYDAERSLLGAIFHQADTIAQVADWLPVEAFGDRRNRSIYAAILRLWSRREPATMVTVPSELQAMKPSADRAAAGDYIRGLITEVDLSAVLYAPYHGDVILAMARRRTIAEHGAELVKAAYGGAVDVDETTRRLRSAVDGFVRADDEPQTFAEQVAAYRETVLRRWSGELVDVILPTGIAGLDRCLSGGIRPGEFFVLAGRPGMGKSSVALHMAQRMRCLFVSLEMPAEMVTNRLIAATARVPYAVGVSTIGDIGQRERWLAASERVEAMPITVTDTIRTTGAIESEIERMRLDGDVDAVVIDHVGRLADPFKASAPSYERMSALSWRCKELAMRAKVGVFGLSQLNREVEGRKGCIPVLSDLRESGRLEEDADHVALLYNRRYYSSRQMGSLEAKDDLDYITGTNWERLTIHVAKNRNGVHGTVDLGWEAQCMAVHETEERFAA